MPALANRQIRLLNYRDLDDGQRVALSAFFREAVLPVLTPLAIDVSRPFPLLSSLSLNLAVLLRAGGRRIGAATGHRAGAAGSRPAGPARRHRGRVVRAARGDHPGASAAALSRAGDPARPRSSGSRATRSWSSTTKAAARSWSWSNASCAGGAARDVVRLEVEASASAELVQLLAGQLDLTSDDVFAVAGPLDLRVLMGLVELPGFDELRDPAFQPVNFLSGAQSDLFAVLDERDVLLHHPYDSYDPVIALAGAGGGRSRRPGHQADALPDQRRLAADREPAARRRTEQAGHRDRRADGAVRRGAQHPVGPRARGGRRARHLRRPRLQDARQDLPDREAHAAAACGATSTSAPATTTSGPRASTPTSA